MKTDAVSVRLLEDPALPPPRGSIWPFTYLDKRLLDQGKPVLGVEATAKAVEEASFDLMAPGDRDALEEVRLLPRRALVEFLMYELPEAADRRVLDDLAGAAPPLPVPDLGGLLQVETVARQLLESVLPVFDGPLTAPTFDDLTAPVVRPLCFDDIKPTLPGVASP